MLLGNNALATKFRDTLNIVYSAECRCGEVCVKRGGDREPCSADGTKCKCKRGNLFNIKFSVLHQCIVLELSNILTNLKQHSNSWLRQGIVLTIGKCRW